MVARLCKAVDAISFVITESMKGLILMYLNNGLMTHINCSSVSEVLWVIKAGMCIALER